jgi:hypothetical protein
MTFYYGLNADSNLGDLAGSVSERNACLDNLGIDRRDFSVLVGTSAAGVTQNDYQNCAGLVNFLQAQLIAINGVSATLTDNLVGKINSTGSSGIAWISGNTVNNNSAYIDLSFGIYSASTASYFSPISGSTFASGGEYRAGSVGFPSGVTVSGLDYKGNTLSWGNYYVKYRSYFELKDSANTTRYIPLYLAPPTALPSNVVWLDSEFSQFTLANAVNISEWKDVNNRVFATQSSSTRRPSYTLQDAGDKPGVKFNGSTDFLSLGDLSLLLLNGATLITVFSLTNSDVSGDPGIYSILDNHPTRSSTWNNNWGLFSESLLARFTAAVAPRNGTHIVSVRASQSYGLEYRLNQNREAFVDASSFVYRSEGTFTIAGPVTFGGTLHCLALYNSVLDDKTLKAQEEYFRWRYGFVWDPDGTPLSYSQLLHSENLDLVEMENGDPLEVG